jgi:Kef-type K+ transport system membrane component KefB
MVLGPSALSNFKPVKGFFFQTTAADFYQVFGLFCRIIFMFLIGLETDIPYAIRNIRNASVIAYGGALLGFAFGLGSSFFLQHQLEVDDHFKSPYVFSLMLILSYTASPVVIRLAGELKFDTSNVGRLAIVSSLIVEMTCLLLFNFMLACHSGKLFKYGFYCFFLSILVMVINKYLANWFNKRNHTQKYLKNTEVFVILSFVIGSAMFMEWANYNSIMNCFVIGLMFPREGKTARTLSHKLTYSVHNFILPIYFGYIGFQFNGIFLNNWRNVIIVLILVLLSIGSKIGGTLAACWYLKIPLNEGVLIGFILNLKGHADILFIGSASKLLIVSFAYSKFFLLFYEVCLFNYDQLIKEKKKKSYDYDLELNSLLKIGL